MQKTIHHQMQQGSITERIQIFLDRIEHHNKEYNAVLQINEHAIAQAKELDRRIAKGERIGRLSGRGIIVKANICVEGMNASCGSKTLENYTAPYDADAITALRREDGIILGLANMDEFACGSSGENSAFGPTHNPSAMGKVPGGSSSGSAASVAADFCDIALGSETGGSIRQPASHCGVIGIKPSYGMVSRHGLIDLSMSLDQIGVLAKKTHDVSLMMDIIAGPSPHDAQSRGPKPDFIKESAQSIKGMTLGVCPALRDMCADKRIYDNVMDVVKRMQERSGVIVREVDIPHIDLAIQTYYPLVYVELFSGTRKFDGKKYGQKIEDVCGEEVLRRILGGREISRAEHHGRYYRLALAAKRAITKGINEAFSHVDLIALPITPKLPHNVGEKIDPRDEYAYDAFTIPANLAGICAGSVPIKKIDGTPVGMQLMAKSFNDAKLLAAMREVEELHA